MASNIVIRMCCQVNVLNRYMLRRNISTCSIVNVLGSATRCNIFLTSKRLCTDKSTDPLQEINIQSITKGNPDLENKLKMLLLEVDLLRQSEHSIPDKIKDSEWEELLQITSKSRRQMYLLYLFKNEKSTENKQRKKEERKLQRQEYLINNPTSSSDDYAIHKNSLFIRIYDKTINQAENSRLLYHSQFTEPLVLDCSYESYMNSMERHNTAKQLTLIFADNRVHSDPFDLHICNLHPRSKTLEDLTRNIPTLHDPGFPLHVHQESYLDIFPRERLVYLTPDCRNDIVEYDPNAIYIIGCIVDKGNSEPLTLAKAKKEGIKMAKLPLDRYLEWGTGACKTLTLNQIVSIMLDKKSGKNWTEAFNNVPRRKLANVQREYALKKLNRTHSVYYDNLLKLQGEQYVRERPKFQMYGKDDNAAKMNVNKQNLRNIPKYQMKYTKYNSEHPRNYIRNESKLQMEDNKYYNDDTSEKDLHFPNKQVTGNYKQRQKKRIFSVGTLYDEETKF